MIVGCEGKAAWVGVGTELGGGNVIWGLLAGHDGVTGWSWCCEWRQRGIG